MQQNGITSCHKFEIWKGAYTLVIVKKITVIDQQVPRVTEKVSVHLILIIWQIYFGQV